MALITRFEDRQAWQEARRSAVEVQSLLYAAFDVEYVTEAQLKEHYEQARKTKALIGGFRHSLKK